MKALLLSLSVIALTSNVFAFDQEGLLDGLIFHAPFDGGTNARIASGDGRIYTAPPSRDPADGKPGLIAEEVTIAGGEGRYGDAIHFIKKSRNMVFFHAAKNVGYRKTNWSGTVSMWLSIDPADLKQEYADPIQITDKKYNDAAIWVDFTKDDMPPQFRMGIFADRSVWNPGDRKPNEIPEAEQPIVRVKQQLFGRDKWTHVALTFSDFNTDSTDGIAKLYVNGELQGTLKDRNQVFTWDLSRATIRVGLGYVGLFDELSIYDRALSGDEIRELHNLPAGLSELRK